MKFEQLLHVIIITYGLAWVPILFIEPKTVPMLIVFGTSLGLSVVIAYGRAFYAYFYCKHKDTEEIVMKRCKKCERVV